MKSDVTKLMLGLVGVLVFTLSAQAADPGNDDASAAAYADGWDNLDDGNTGGGDGMGAWVFGSGVNAANHGIASSLGLGGGSGAIDSSGVAFKLHDDTGAFIDMYRFFDPAPGLDVGQIFTMDMAVNYRGGFKGIDLRDSTDATIFNLNVGGDDYTINGASIGDAYSSDTVFHLAFTQASLAGGTWTVTRSGGVSDFESGTYTGQLRSIKLYGGGLGTFAEDAVYYNNFSVTPEPTSLALLALGGGLVLARRRRV